MTSQTPAGWYPDPYGSPQLRWWDGNQWTDATHAQEQTPPTLVEGGTDWSAHPANPTLQFGQPTQGQSQYGQPDPQASSGPQPPPGSTPFAQPSSGANPYAPPSSGANAYEQPPAANPYAQPSSGGNPYGQPPSGANQYAQPSFAENPYAQQQPGQQAQQPGQHTQPGQYAQPGQFNQQPGQYGQPPYGQQPTAQYGQYGQLPGPTAYGQQPKKPGGPLPWILGGVGVLVVVALIVVAAVVVVNRTGGTTAQETPPPSSDIFPTPTETEDPGTTSTPDPAPSTMPGIQDGRITDPQAGVSFQAPEGWTVPPADRVNGTDPTQQRWTSAVEAVSHEKYNGESNWIGNVYSGALNELYPYENGQSLQTAAGAVLASFSNYYQLTHTRKIVKNEALKIGDKDAWVLQFELDFSKISEEKKYKWKKENGAVVLMDRGPGERPALVYISVPDNLGTDVVDQVIGSLKPA
ncbi:DUF2510 domain-containing protein [Nonomuraea endophytica]|uniref:DUF2510 domain-containing protein n=1 Tax=Nonomuraea endophytica TaxID=714136 RepID=A0A7W7ZZF7_9ACTN|nr:DUF2510 domain-containing protein [Nonomuraea endophytica]MBB5076589.1 hypothetical protein [Nonomuraea endophytica]